MIRLHWITIYRDIEVYWRAEFVVSLPRFFPQSCLGRPSADWLAQAGLREKALKRNNKLSSPLLHFNVSILGVSCISENGFLQFVFMNNFLHFTNYLLEIPICSIEHKKIIKSIHRSTFNELYSRK